ncbi:hypothetical protein [Streptomyces sp. NPDC047525]
MGVTTSADTPTPHDLARALADQIRPVPLPVTSPSASASAD